MRLYCFRVRLFQPENSCHKSTQLHSCVTAYQRHPNSNCQYPVQERDRTTSFRKDKFLHNNKPDSGPSNPLFDSRRLCRYFAKNYLASLPKIHSLTRQLIPFAPTALRTLRFRTTSNHFALLLHSTQLPQMALRR